MLLPDSIEEWVEGRAALAADRGDEGHGRGQALGVEDNDPDGENGVRSPGDDPHDLVATS